MDSAFTISVPDRRAIFAGNSISSLGGVAYNSGFVAFDLVTHQQTDAIGFTPLGSGSFTTLQRFGIDGFAGLNANVITLFHSHIANSVPMNAPFISSLSPATAAQGTSGVQVVVTGSGFAAGVTPCSMDGPAPPRSTAPRNSRCNSQRRTC